MLHKGLQTQGDTLSPCLPSKHNLQDVHREKHSVEQAAPQPGLHLYGVCHGARSEGTRKGSGRALLQNLGFAPGFKIPLSHRPWPGHQGCPQNAANEVG